jgi:heme A synthase
MIKLNRFSTYAWAVTAFSIAVIIWGAFVRASESGDGCGSHWPLCNGTVVPQAPDARTLVEMTHRLTSGLALILVVGLFIQAFRAFPKGHRVRKAALLSLIFIILEALIGAGLVLFGLVARDDSIARAVVLAVHLTNTFMLLASLSLTAWWSSGGPAPRIGGQARVTQWLLAATLAGTLLIGISGAVAALGDTLFPSDTLAEGVEQDLSTTAHVLIRLRLLHPVIALAVGALVFFTASTAPRAHRDLWVKRLSTVTLGLLLAQLLAGMTNVALLAPVWLQLVHLLLADLMWIALILLTASTLAARESEALESASTEPSGLSRLTELEPGHD